MYISLLDVHNNYHGVQRKQDCLLNDKIKYIDLYYSLLQNEYIPYTLKNIYIVLEICNRLKLNSLQHSHEVIIYGRHKMEIIHEDDINLEFLGFDVSGDSCYLSPLETVFFESENIAFFNEIKELFAKFINEYGLFSTITDALKFISHIDSCNHEKHLEKDGTLEPVWIYRVKYK